MKKKVGLYCVLFVVVAAAAFMGCKTGFNLPGIPCTSCQDYTTLQGTIMDAITGERIGGNDMEIYLIQGSTVRTPTTFNTGATLRRWWQNNDNETATLMGDYSFTDIPSETDYYDDDAGLPVTGEDPDQENTREYKIVVYKPGYQEFNAEIEFDNEANVIGNIYLFPIDFYAPDYTYTVVFMGKPVPNAAVGFYPLANDNHAVTQTGSRLGASPGYLPGIKKITNAQGQVTFEGSELPLGARYSVSVAPVEFEGIQLAPAEDYFTIYIGNANVDGIIPLGELEPGNNMFGLYVKSISNSVEDQVDSTGTLTIKFNRKVVLGTRTAPLTADFSATETSPTGVLDATKQANASLSSDGLTLTLTPNWGTTPSAGEANTSITYNNGTGFLSVDGYPDSEILLSNLVNAAGTNISASPTGLTVHLTTP